MNTPARRKSQSVIPAQTGIPKRGVKPLPVPVLMCGALIVPNGILLRLVLISLCLLFSGLQAETDPYKDSGIPGFVDSGLNPINPETPGAEVHPVFCCWATNWIAYEPAAQRINQEFTDPQNALGPVTGQQRDVVSLGDLNQTQINQEFPPGRITLTFYDDQTGDPNGIIPNGPGNDFAVFENGFIAALSDAGQGILAGQMFAELAYVEVSSDNQHFARFPSASLTPTPVGAFGTVEITQVHNLAGKHPNSNGQSFGTPFDLSDLVDHTLVINGQVDLAAIRYLRIVDIPGSGNFTDEASVLTDPETAPLYNAYGFDHPVYDVWHTMGSGGFDLEAVGLMQEQQYAADINLDGLVDYRDFQILGRTWLSQFGNDDYLFRSDLAQPRDYQVNTADLILFASQWLGVELWRE